MDVLLEAGRGMKEEKGPGLVASHFIFSCQSVSVSGLGNNDGGVGGEGTHVLFVPSGRRARRVMKEKNCCLLCPGIATFFMFYYHVV